MPDSEDRVALRDMVRSLLAAQAGEVATRQHMDGDGFDRTLWKSMAGAGLLGLVVPEEYGGAGAGWREQAIVHGELGRMLACVPFLGTAALATAALLSASAEARQRWLPAITEGTVTATVAPGSSSGSWYDPVDMKATSYTDGWRLTGRAPYVLDGPFADLLLVAARTDAGIEAFVVSELEREEVVTSDRTRRVAHLTLRDTPAEPIGEWSVIRAAHRTGVAMLACEQTGGAAACLDSAVEYAKTRQQFGRAIGSFQAVQHHCANMLLRVETARTAADRAATGLDVSSNGVVHHLIAGSVCTEAFTFCASTSVQVHGGIGFTWEHPAHLYVKRSRGSAVLLGQASDHRNALKSSGEVLVGL